MRKLIPLLVCALVLAGCAIPHQRSDLAIEKTSARTSEVEAVFKRYREVRNTAIELLDAKPLSTVETDAVLAIDSGSFEVSQRLAQTQTQNDGVVDVTDIFTPRFTKYPLWFVGVARDRGLGINRIQVFERTSAVDPWLLVASPETLAETALPDIRTTGGDVAVKVNPDNGSGMALSAQGAADAYAKTLADEGSSEAKTVENDSFIKLMRATASTNAALKDVGFTQGWDADPVKYVLRTSDGGALAFVTLLRLDTYTVKKGLTVTWPKGSPQEAFLSSGITNSGKLRFYHQVLLYIPGGSGLPRAIGQYGGVVGAEGE